MNLHPSSQIILFEHRYVFNELVKLYNDKKLPNKIILSGEKGIGKSTISYHFINFVLSQNEENPYDIPCEQFLTRGPDNIVINME